MRQANSSKARIPDAIRRAGPTSHSAIPSSVSWAGGRRTLDHLHGRHEARVDAGERGSGITHGAPRAIRAKRSAQPAASPCRPPTFALDHPLDAISANLATVFMLRAVPILAAGIRSLERAIPLL